MAAEEAFRRTNIITSNKETAGQGKEKAREFYGTFMPTSEVEREGNGNKEHFIVAATAKVIRDRKPDI